MSYIRVGNEEVFNSCNLLYWDIRDKGITESSNIVLKRSNDGSVFHIEDTYLEYEYIENFFKKVEFDISSIKSISLSNIFNYVSDMAYLYSGGCYLIDDKELLTLPFNDSNYPIKENVLVPLNNRKWLIGYPSEFFKNTLKSINKLVPKNVESNILRVHMVNDDLVLSSYGIGRSSIDYVYSSGDYRLDVLLENMINISNRFSFSVKDIYWFVKEEYSKTNARKNSDGEFTLVIS